MTSRAYEYFLKLKQALLPMNQEDITDRVSSIDNVLIVIDYWMHVDKTPTFELDQVHLILKASDGQNFKLLETSPWYAKALVEMARIIDPDHVSQELVDKTTLTLFVP